MNELTFVYALAALIFGLAAFQVVTRKFDPFAPTWLFLVGIFQEYVVQAISYHDWAIRVRGVDVVAEASFRSFWAIAWMLTVYYFGPGKWLAKLLPKPPMFWSPGVVDAGRPDPVRLGTGVRADRGAGDQRRGRLAVGRGDADAPVPAPDAGRGGGLHRHRAPAEPPPAAADGARAGDRRSSTC